MPERKHFFLREGFPKGSPPSGRGLPPPFRAMPERKHFFFSGGLPLRLQMNFFEFGKALSCGPFPTVFDFSFVIPTNQISSHPPQLQVFRRQFLKFLLFFASSRHHWIMKNAPAFLLRKISLISCHHHFLCVDLWPKPRMFSSRQTCVLPKANPCFANAQGNVLPPSI